MLWMKAWLEIRWRFFFMLGMAGLVIGMGEQGGGLPPENAQNLMHAQLMLAIITAFNLAGSGIRTQFSFRPKRGLHGSTQVTLSMPVSRLQLLAVRASFGLIATGGVVILLIVSAWCLFPAIRRTSTRADMSMLVLASVVCVSCFYFVSLAIRYCPG